MGTFSHEAAAVDPVLGHVYLTEDKGDGRFYRFTPTAAGDLTSGLLEVARVDPDPKTRGRAAEMLGISLKTLYNRLNQYRVIMDKRSSINERVATLAQALGQVGVDRGTLSPPVRELVASLVKVPEFSAAEPLLRGELRPTRGKKETTDHPPIYPTQAVYAGALRDDAHRRVYELVARRFLATFAPPMVTESTRADIEAGSETYFVRGSVVPRSLPGGIDVPAESFAAPLAAALRDDQHPFLRLAEQDLVGRHAGLAHRHLRRVDRDADVAAADVPDRAPVPGLRRPCGPEFGPGAPHSRGDVGRTGGGHRVPLRAGSMRRSSRRPDRLAKKGGDRP